MKLTYALLRKQRTHNLRYVVQTSLMKLAPDFPSLADELISVLRLLNCSGLILYLIETPLKAFENRTDPDKAALMIQICPPIYN